MDTGLKVKCHRCTGEFQMYDDTHTVKYANILGRKIKMLAGMCPSCNAMVTARYPVKRDLINKYFILYPSHPIGVKITPCPYFAGNGDC
jgi:hypothetical protein